ncbi:MAG TPA: ABC transporter substrate-binding protein, partial [Desulfurococcaceae archaeon]|nr:ABC transporter substrate-binding protein [Desulfurococcaceae archaeon]
DGLVWTFKIVENAYWHDGVPLTARDIVFTIEFYQKYKPPAHYPNVEFIEKTEIVDDYTFKIYLKEPFVWLLRRFGYTIILPEHIWKYVPKVFEDPQRFNPLKKADVDKVLEVIKKEAPPDIAKKVEDFVSKYGHLRIGSGPYMLVRWVEGELLDLVKHPMYFKKGFPRADRLIFKVYASDEAQYLAIKTGEAHIMMWTIPYAVIKEAEANPNIVLPKTPDVYIGYIGFNLKDPITGNKLVRKAIAYALNKEFVVKTLMLGYAEAVYTYVHPAFEKWVNFDVPKYEFDLKKAAELLDKAGFKDVDGDGWRETPEGKDFELTIFTPSYDPVRVRIGDLLAETLKKIGVKLINKPMDFDTLVDYVYNKHEFQMYIIENDANFQPWYYSSYYVEEQYVPGGNNPWGFINKTFEDLLRKAEKEVDEAKRVEIYKKLQEILADELPLLPVYVRFWMQAYRAELSGVVEMAGGALNFWTLINANFRGLKPELPYTKLITPTPTTTPITSPPVTTPTTPPPTPAVRTVTKFITQTATITKLSTLIKTETVQTTITVGQVPPAFTAGAVIGIIIAAIIAFFIGRKLGRS